MDFVVGLSRTKQQHDTTWVIMDRISKSEYFLPIKTTYLAEDYAKLYIKEIMKLYGNPFSIISYKGTPLTSNFFKVF